LEVKGEVAFVAQFQKLSPHVPEIAEQKRGENSIRVAGSGLRDEPEVSRI